MPKPFHLDLNLDDETECRDFIETHGQKIHPQLATDLGLQGEGATNLAIDLRNYALIKAKAMDNRLAGNIQTALNLEARCDRIYRYNIQPVCDCW